MALSAAPLEILPLVTLTWKISLFLPSFFKGGSLKNTIFVLCYSFYAVFGLKHRTRNVPYVCSYFRLEMHLGEKEKRVIGRNADPCRREHLLACHHVMPEKGRGVKRAGKSKRKTTKKRPQSVEAAHLKTKLASPEWTRTVHLIESLKGATGNVTPLNVSYSREGKSEIRDLFQTGPTTE